jgi:ATP synthase protein I
MPDPDENSRDALKRLDHRLGAFEASRKARTPATGLGGEAGTGYRLLGQLLGGVFGGLGLGWLIDRFAHTGPWGLLGGLAIGAVGSIWAAVMTASRASAAAEAMVGAAAAPARPKDEDEDET